MGAVSYIGNVKWKVRVYVLSETFEGKRGPEEKIDDKVK